MQRIWIIGASGSGKTTLARLIAKRLGIEAVDLDELHWQPGWQTTPAEELLVVMDSLTSKESWVISGNYSALQGFLPRADTLIWLDYPFSRVLWQLLRRTARRVLRNEACCNGNHETLQRVFSRDSVVLWLLRTYKKRRDSALRTMAEPRHGHLKVWHFKTPLQTADWLKTLENV